MCECPKCGSSNTKVQIDEDQLRSFYYCPDCGNEWSRAGINRKGENTPKAGNPFIIPILCLAGVVIMLAFAFSQIGSKAASDQNDQSRSVSVPSEGTTDSVIKQLRFTEMADVTVKIGESSAPGYLEVSMDSAGSFEPEDIVFVSENTDIAVISFIRKDVFSPNLYFEITGVSSGETNVYAITKDKTVRSEGIHVIVPEPVQVESIDIGEVKTDLIVGERFTVNAAVSPEDAEDKTLSWASSDDTVVTVDSDGNITAVGGGTATVTVSSVNNVNAAFEAAVDGTKALMQIGRSCKRVDDNNTGNEWSYDFEINGEKVPDTMEVSVGDTITFSAKLTENDDIPDVGTGSASHTITEDDILNGFEVSFDVYVQENAGRNSGKSAHFVVNYRFSL